MTIGIIADIHYADREYVGSRYYRDSLVKVRDSVRIFREYKTSFCINLGDIIDKAEDVQTELGYFKTIKAELDNLSCIWYHAVGNHDVATFSKKEFLANCGMQSSYYSFECGDFHFVILDACYNKDESDYNSGNFDWIETYMPDSEQHWLDLDLQKTAKKTIIFIHQRLDDENDAHGVKNADKVRNIIEKSGKVIAVLQGHDHHGAYSCINGIHYFSFRAAVVGSGLENNACSLVHIHKNNSLEIKGFGKQESKILEVIGD